MRIIIFAILAIVSFNPISRAEKFTEVYPGKLLRKEIVSQEVSNLPKAELLMVDKSLVSLAFSWSERVFIQEKPVYEKVIVTKEAEKPNDPGIREVAANEFIDGKTEQRETITEKGAIAQQEIHYLETQAVTDDRGVLIDRQQVILEQFDDLRKRQLPITFTSPGKPLDVIKLMIEKAEFLEKMGLNFARSTKSHPDNLRMAVKWEYSFYRPGDVAKLLVTVNNAGPRGAVSRIQARSLSRWTWLDGKQFYLGDLEPQQEKSFFRYIRIPAEVEEGTYYLRVGFNEYSGAKPQVSCALVIHNLTPK